MLNILLWILFGALAGWIASIIMKTDAQMGPVANIIVGIVGAIIGGLVVRLLTGSFVGGFSLLGLIVAVLGAVILLAIVKAFNRRSARNVS